MSRWMVPCSRPEVFCWRCAMRNDAFLCRLAGNECVAMMAANLRGNARDECADQH
jgi:hypothetical protein